MLLKRNFKYNKDNIEFTIDGTKIICTQSGTTSINPLRIPQNCQEIVDGTVVWKILRRLGE